MLNMHNLIHILVLSSACNNLCSVESLVSTLCTWYPRGVCTNIATHQGIRCDRNIDLSIPCHPGIQVVIPSMSAARIRECSVVYKCLPSLPLLSDNEVSARDCRHPDRTLRDRSAELLRNMKVILVSARQHYHTFLLPFGSSMINVLFLTLFSQLICQTCINILDGFNQAKS